MEPTWTAYLQISSVSEKSTSILCLEKVEIVTDFSFLGSKITVDGDCSHEIKRCLLLGRKAMTNIDSVLKRRDITLLTKIHVVKAMVFSVVTHGYASWTIREAEHRRMDTWQLWRWKSLRASGLQGSNQPPWRGPTLNIHCKGSNQPS